MSSSKRQIYDPLCNNPVYDPSENTENCSCKASRSIWRPISTVFLFLLLLANVAVVLVGHTSAAGRWWLWIDEKDEGLLHDYSDLGRYNTTEVFIERLDLVNRSSDDFWHRVRESDGIVAVDTDWALQHNYTTSAPHPDLPTQSIYQVDVFHALHCLNRLRLRLVSHLSPEQWQRNDDHTLHCVDYLRQYLMCNTDLTLKASKDLTAFTRNHEHQCRDYSAVNNWVSEHQWAGYRKWLDDHNNMVE